MIVFNETSATGELFYREYNPSTHNLHKIFVEGVLKRVDIVPIIAPTVEELAYEINSQLERICEAVERWVTGELNAAGMVMVERILALDPTNAMAMATAAWVEAEYDDAEIRKYYVQMGAWTADYDPADFSMRIKKPYLGSILKLEYNRLRALP